MEPCAQFSKKGAAVALEQTMPSSCRYPTVVSFACIRGSTAEFGFRSVEKLHGFIHHIGPEYRFHTIAGDPDDDAFAACAIAVGAEWSGSSHPITTSTP